MGIATVVQDERGNNISEIVHDPNDVIAQCLPDPADGTFSCVRFIDPYGDTVFNWLQARVMIDEWARLKPAFMERQEEALWSGIYDLIIRCSEEPHIYLKFIGD